MKKYVFLNKSFLPYKYIYIIKKIALWLLFHIFQILAD